MMRQSNHQYSSTPDHYSNNYHSQSQQKFSIKSSSTKGGRSSLIIPTTNNQNNSYTTSQSQIHFSSGNVQTTQPLSSQNLLPPSSSVSMKLKNSLIIQKEAQKNKENVFKLKERVEEAQKRVENLEKYEKSFSGMTDLLNGMAKDFKQSYVVSRTSYSPQSQQQKSYGQKQMHEEIELTRGNMNVVDSSLAFGNHPNNNQHYENDSQQQQQQQYTYQKQQNNYQSLKQSPNQQIYNDQLSQDNNTYNNNYQFNQVQNQRRFGSQVDIQDDNNSYYNKQFYPSNNFSNSQQSLNSQAITNNSSSQVNLNNKLQYNNITNNNDMINRKNTLFKDIKNKMELFKTQNRESITKHLKYIANKINESRDTYYNFFEEENKVALKFLVQVLYDEVEKIIILDGGNNLPQKLKLEDLTREINEKNKKIQQLEEELIEKNLHINTITTKLTRYTQRFNDLRWILEESKRIYEDFTHYQQELLSSDMYAYDESRKLKFIQITNIQKEFNRLKENFDELKIGNSNQKTNPHQANFFHSQGNSYTPHQSSIPPLPPNNSQIKHINNYQLDHSASSSSQIGIAPEILIKKQLEFDEDYQNQNNINCFQNNNGNPDSHQSTNNLFNLGQNNSNSQTSLGRKQRHNSVSSTNHSMMVLNKIHQPQITNRSQTPNQTNHNNQGNHIEGMYQSNIVISDHNQNQNPALSHSQILNNPHQTHQRGNQSMIILNNNNTSSSQIFGKNNKFLDIKQQIEQLENEYNDLDNIQQSLEDQVAKYKHCFVEQLKLCQLLQKSVHNLEEDNNQLKQQLKQPSNMRASQLVQAANQANQHQAELEKLEKELQKVNQQIKQTQKECEYLQQENSKIQKEKNEIQQQYSKQLKEIQDIEEQRQSDKIIVQKLNSQFQQMKKECEEKSRLEDKIKSLSNDNNHLNKELDECLGLLESGKINIEQLKITLQSKEESSQDIVKKNANLENQVFLKQKEIDVLSQEIKKYLEQLDQLQKNGGKQAAKQLQEQQQQTLSQIEFLIYEENMNEEIQKETKLLIIQLFGCEFLQFIEKIQERHLYAVQFNSNIYDKLQVHCNGRIQASEDLKVMGQMILQAYEVLSRHSHVQLPTPLMMLREELEMKRPAIQDKLQECMYEQQQIFEDFNGISLMNSQFTKGKNMSESLQIQYQQESQLKSNEIQSLKQRIEYLSNENFGLQQNIKNLELQNGQLNLQNSTSQNLKLPRPSIEHNRQSEIQSCRSSKRPSRLKQDQDDYQSTYSTSGLNSVKNSSPSKLSSNLFDVNEEFLQLILSQASSIEQLLNQ